MRLPLLCALILPTWAEDAPTVSDSQMSDSIPDIDRVSRGERNERLWTVIAKTAVVMGDVVKVTLRQDEIQSVLGSTYAERLGHNIASLPQVIVDQAPYRHEQAVGLLSAILGSDPNASEAMLEHQYDIINAGIDLVLDPDTILIPFQVPE